MGARTGIIFNNEMDDFAKPDNPSWTDDAWTAPSNENNWIEPGKRPLSSVSPSVILDKEGNVRLVTGGSGGSKIISATATVSIWQISVFTCLSVNLLTNQTTPIHPHAIFTYSLSLFTHPPSYMPTYLPTRLHVPMCLPT